MKESRRGYLKIIGAVGATCAFPFSADELYGQQSHTHGEEGSPVVGPFEPKFFTAEEGGVIVRIADLIIPPTDTPGAAAAGVPQYIDSILLRNKEQQARFREGIAWIEEQSKKMSGKPFVEMAESEQVALLTPLSDTDGVGKGAAFFQAMKNMTADGYYTSHAGLVLELGYKGNRALPGFDGCVHEQ